MRSIDYHLAVSQTWEMHATIIPAHEQFAAPVFTPVSVDRVTHQHYSEVIMGAMASQITSLTIVYLTLYSGADKKTPKLRVTGLCARNSPVTGEFPLQIASNAENVSIWWCHHEILNKVMYYPVEDTYKLTWPSNRHLYRTTILSIDFQFVLLFFNSLWLMWSVSVLS